jgi:hypothetical protein
MSVLIFSTHHTRISYFGSLYKLINWFDSCHGALHLKEGKAFSEPFKWMEVSEWDLPTLLHLVKSSVKPRIDSMTF